MLKPLLCSALLLLFAAGAVSAADKLTPPKFAKPPAATRVGDKVTITFAVDRETDIAVYVLDAKGAVVRHLVAGMLGKNAPEPLKPNSLSQSIEWDGKDDLGRAAAGGPVNVRVAAGMKVKHAGYPLEKPGEPYHFLWQIQGMGIGPDGGVYAMVAKIHGSQRGYHEIQRYTRDGRYAGTVSPFPGQLSKSDARGWKPRQGHDGRQLLRYWPHTDMTTDIPHMPVGHRTQITAVDAKGRLVMLCRIRSSKGKLQLGVATIGPDGQSTGNKFASTIRSATPIAFELTGKGVAKVNASWSLALSDADPETAFVTGLSAANPKNGRPVGNLHAVYRLPVARDGELKPFFGDPGKAGADQSHLGSPAAVAVDGKGKVFIADLGNNRVVVLDEKTGKWQGSFKVAKPCWVGVHRGTGAIYVQSLARAPSELLKFSGADDPKLTGRLALPRAKTAAKNHERLWMLALDAWGKTPRIWMGINMHPVSMNFLTSPLASKLAFVDDLGAKFSDFRSAQEMMPEKKGVREAEKGVYISWVLTSDPTHRYIVSRPTHRSKTARIIDDRTGAIISSPGGADRMGPDGLLYYFARSICRRTLKGAPVPFKTVAPKALVYTRNEKGAPVVVGQPKEGQKLAYAGTHEIPQWLSKGKGLPIWTSGTSGNERDFTIDRKGNIYFKMRGGRYHGHMTVGVYDKNGNFLRTVIWECSDRSYGPRVDANSNIYMAEGVFDGDGYLPEGKGFMEHNRKEYGSIVKFGPEGGAVWMHSQERYKKNFGLTPPKLNMNRKTVSTIQWRGPIKKDSVLEGAKWRKPGFSPIQPEICHCNGSSFDVDDFGRVFYPDMLQFQVVVLDTNGNEIHRFGSYGNRDNRGPYSWIRDEETGGLRPRKEDDPESPWAKPEIPFTYLNSVAVTDRNIYTADVLSQRVTKIRVDYAADVTCEVN